MKIAVLTSSYPRYEGDGAAPFVRSIAIHLANLGHEVEVVAPYDPEVKPFGNDHIRVTRFRYVWPKRLHILGHARALSADVRLRPLAIFLLPFFLLFAFISLMGVTSRQKSQIIYVHWVIPNGLVAAWVAAIRKVPFIISLHGSDIFVASHNPLYGAVARWVFHRAAAVTACSSDLKKAAIDLGAPEDTLLVAWGADPVLFHPIEAGDGFKPRKMDDSPKVYLAALGRLVYKKGFDVLLAAMPDVIRRCPNVRLIIGGDGPLKRELADRSAELGLLGFVDFPGQIPWDQVPNFLAAADIFVLPSIRDRYGNADGLPTVLPEAMACGNPVIASDIGGVGLVITHDQNGLLVPPNNPGALGEAILTLVKDSSKRVSLGRAARQSVVQQFNWNAVALKIHNVCENVIWRQLNPPRLGTAYRAEVIKILQKIPKNGRVLDVGCHDGYWLNSLDVTIRVGVDPEPKIGAPGVMFVQADGNHLPFNDGTFNYVFAQDVIEHIQDDSTFARSLIRMVATGGNLFLSTPSAKISLFPPFLTQWISHQWGHDLRLGYTPAELSRLFESDLKINIQTWNAPAYRFWYLPLRLLSVLFPKMAIHFVRRTAHRDADAFIGEKGFFHLEGYKPSN